MKIAIIQYEAGNIYSVQRAVQRLGYQALVTCSAADIKSADKVIFPGVGEASSAMDFIRARGIEQLLPQLQQPVLGICLGLQLMCRTSEENNTPCLGIFNGTIKKFPARGKVPHMGWNTIHSLRGPLFNDVPDRAYVYFVHSYYAEPNSHTTAVSDYLLPFAAGLQKRNFYAVQFHPEKSGKIGETIFRNFLEL